MAKTALQVQRVKAGYKSAREFADSIGMNLSTYTKYEQGSRGINLEQAREFADALKCRLDDLADMPSDATESAEEAPEAIDPREKLLSDYDSLTEDRKRTLETVASALAATSKTE